ncbi:MAG: hypothetical protein V2A34_15875, partial [Lentisphaerota bacterium]
MRNRQGNKDPLNPWPQKRHGIAVTAAVVVSVALHVLLLQHFPPLAIGKPAEADLMRQFPSIQLQKVMRSDTVPSLERPTR